MLEIMIITCFIIAAFCIGNVIGWSGGKTHGEAKAHFEMLISKQEHHRAHEHERLLDDLSRQSLAFSQKQKHWIKVYDAEVIE